MRKRLSSDLTFAYKFVFPPLFVGMPAIWAGCLVPRLGWIQAMIAALPLWLLALPVVCMLSRLKSVIATDQCLVVGNYFKKVDIAYGSVCNVREYRISGISAVSVHLTCRTRLGCSFLYLTPGHTYFYLPFGREHPDIAFLRRRVREEGGTA